MMSRKDSDPAKPRLGEPDYWEQQAARATKMRARFKEEEQPQKVVFKAGYIDRKLIEEAINSANRHQGTKGETKALVAICTYYLSHGPKARAMESATLKKIALTTRMEDIIRDMEPGEIIAAFNKIHPSHAILDFPV